MAKTAHANLSFGISAAGLTDVRLQPLTAAGASTGPALAHGDATISIVAMGLGMFTFTGSVPDDAVHWKAYSAGQPSTYIDSGILSIAASAGGSVSMQTDEVTIT